MFQHIFYINLLGLIIEFERISDDSTKETPCVYDLSVGTRLVIDED